MCQQAEAEACSAVCHEKGVCVCVCVCVCVTRGLLMSVSTGSGMDVWMCVCGGGWVGIFGKRY